MKVHTSGFKDAIKSLGREISAKITYTLNNEEIELGNSELNSISIHYEGGLLKSVMKQLDLDSNVDIPLETQIKAEFGLKVDSEYEYLNYGNYIVYSSEKQEDTNSYKIIAYDKLLYSMKDYETILVNNTPLEYPIAIREYIDALCNSIGLTFANKNDVFANYDKQIPNELYLDEQNKSLGYTYRDVLDELAQATASTICINDNDELELRYITLAGTTTNVEGTSIYITDAVKQGALYEGVNNITQVNNDLPFNLELEYMRQADVETINKDFLKDTDVNFGEKYGPINSIVLSRSADTDKVYLQDDDSVAQNGLCEMQIVDNQIMNGNDRSDYLPDILNILDGLEYYINDLSSTGICYLDLCDMYNVNIDGNIYKCVMLNDEINIEQGIEERIHTDLPEESETDYTKADKTDRRINQAYIIINKHTSEIAMLSSKVVDLSNTIQGYNSITLENAYEGALHNLSIYGDMSLVFPGNSQYPKSTLYPLDTILKVDSEEYKLDIDYLRYLSATAYDEFIYEDGKCKIIRRVGVNQNNQLYALDEPIEEEREDIVIYVKSNSVIQMKSFENLHYKSEYLLENKYTSTFANQVEVKSEINLLGDTIEQKVSKVADDDGNVTSASIILAVNNDSSSAEINAEKINLNGVVTANGNFKILEDGSMETTNGTFSGQIKGGKIDLYGIYSEDDPYIKIDTPLDDPTGYKTVLLHNSGLRVIDYLGMEETRNVEATIRTETLDGYAELDGTQVNAFGFNNVSLLEKKDNIVKFKENALELIKDIDIYNYTYKGQIGEKRHIGVVIGDGYKYREEITNDENNSIDLYSFVSLCCKAIQEQQKQIDKLRKEIEKCKK